MRLHPAFLLTAAMLAAAPALARDPAPSDAERLQRRLAGLVPGKPTGCINRGPTDQSETLPGVVVYKAGGTTYVNRFDGGCQVRPDFDILVTSTPSTQLCRGDVAQIVDSGSRIPRGSCIYGDWETYNRPKPVK